MDVLCYYKNQRRVAVFELHRDFRIRTLGSYKDNDYILPGDDVGAIHLKVRFQNGFYQAMAVAESLMEGEISLPLNSWIDLPPQKKIWLTPENKNDYIVFMQNVAVTKSKSPASKIRHKTAQMRMPGKSSATKEMPQMPPRKPGKRPTKPSHDDERIVTERKPRKVLKLQTSTQGFEQMDREQFAKQPKQSVEAEQKTMADTFTPPQKLKLAPDPFLDMEQGETMCDSYKVVEPNALKGGDGEGLWIEERYRVVDILGKGGMGTVYKVVDEKVGRVVALKLLQPQDKSTLEANQRFVAEARSMAKLRHKNIVRVYDNGIHEGLPYFTMDLVEGVELQKHIHGLKPRKAMRWMLSICEAVYYFHQSGVIHRDLKPSNVMISSSGEPLLMDFGIARDEASRSSLTAAGQSIGTPAYMAPEQAKGQNEQIDNRTDIYGMGAILYEMLTGNPPFSGPPMQVLFKVCSEEPKAVRDLNPHVPKDIVTIVEKAMSKEKVFRYESANDMATDIRRYLDGLRIHAQPPSLPMRIVRKFRQNRNFGYIVLSCAILLMLLVVGLLYSRYKASIDRENSIKKMLAKAEGLMTDAQTENDNAISDYIKASEKYTNVLRIDSENEKGREGKFRCLCQMGEYAAQELRDYHFAQTMYHNALEMGIDDNAVKEKLRELERLKKYKDLKLKKDVKKVFAYLQR